MWHLGDGEWAALLEEVKRVPTRTDLRSFPCPRIPDLDPDVVLGGAPPRLLKKQALESLAVSPLVAVTPSNDVLLINAARERVWRVLASGGIDKQNARKKETLLHWNENQFRSVFKEWGAAGPVTIRKKSPTIPPIQPPTFEAAWASKRKRELQVVLSPGRVMERWCRFQDFNTGSNPERFYYGHGRKQIGVKMISEIAAIFTVDSSKRPGKECRVSLYISTVRVKTGGEVEWSYCSWPTTRDIDDGDDATNAVLEFHDRLMRSSSRASKADVADLTDVIEL